MAAENEGVEEGEAEPEPITGKYPALARKVRAMIGKTALRVVARKSGVNHTTLSTMVKGDRASADSTMRFARAYGLNPNVLLRLSELEPIPEFDLIDWAKSRPLGAGAADAPPTETVTLPSGRRVGLYSVDGKPIALSADALLRLDLEAELLERGGEG